MWEVADGTHEDSGRRTDSPIARLILEARAHHAHVLEAQPPDRALQEAGLLLAGLEQDDRRLRPGDRQWNSGKPGAAPDVERRCRRPLEDREWIERIEDVARVDRGSVAVGDQGERCGRIVNQPSILSEERESLGRPASGRAPGRDRRLKRAVVPLQIRGEVARRRGVVHVRHRW